MRYNINNNKKMLTSPLESPPLFRARHPFQVHIPLLFVHPRIGNYIIFNPNRGPISIPPTPKTSSSTRTAISTTLTTIPIIMKVIPQKQQRQVVKPVPQQLQWQRKQLKKSSFLFTASFCFHHHISFLFQRCTFLIHGVHFGSQLHFKQQLFFEHHYLPSRFHYHLLLHWSNCSHFRHLL